MNGVMGVPKPSWTLQPRASNLHAQPLQKLNEGIRQHRHVTLRVRVTFKVLTGVTMGARGGVVVKVLRYKPAGRGFDSR